jgi:putative transposase
MNALSKRRRNFLQLNVHFVWTTKERLPLIEPGDERQLHRFIVSAYERFGGSVLAIGGMPDHVHVLVSISPKFAISNVIKGVKGTSSLFFSTSLKPEAWFEWQPNYAAISVSNSHVKRVTEYILNQKAHHHKGTLEDRFERTDEEYDPDTIDLQND